MYITEEMLIKPEKSTVKVEDTQ